MVCAPLQQMTHLPTLGDRSDQQTVLIAHSRCHCDAPDQILRLSCMRVGPGPTREVSRQLLACRCAGCGYVGLGFAGQEYEALLSEKLRCAGIAFFSEDKLREEGFFKTPDVKLEVWTRVAACHTSDMAPAFMLP